MTLRADRATGLTLSGPASAQYTWADVTEATESQAGFALRLRGATTEMLVVPAPS